MLIPSQPMVRRRIDPVYQQFFLMAAILLATDLLARGSGDAARAFFMAAAVGSSLYYIRRSPWLYITMTFWFWTLTPFARRLIDYQAGFDPVDFMLATPELISLLMLGGIGNSRDLMRSRETVTGLFIAVPVIYGIAVSFVQGQIVAGVIGCSDWIGPPLYYFFIIANWRKIPEFETSLSKFLGLNVAFMTVYCVYQFVAPPVWDVAWLTNSAMVGMGKPEPFQMRSFGTLNSAGVLASWLGMSVLLFLHFKTRLTALLLPAAAMVVILTYVRSEVSSVLVCYLIAGLLGQGGITKILLVGAAGLTLLFAVVSTTVPEVNDLILTRVESVEDLGHDSSANARQDIWAATPRAIAAAPWGLGIGATGRGAVSKQDNDDLTIIDSGVLGIYLPLGWIAGTVYFLGIVLMIVQAVSAARQTRLSSAIALTVAAISQILLLPFVNVLGLGAVQLWFCCGYAAALGMHVRINEYLATRPVDRFVRPREKATMPTPDRLRRFL